MDEKVLSMIFDLMQLEASFVSTDINAVYRMRTYVRESINIGSRIYYMGSPI